jgi:hypothetical protein
MNRALRRERLIEGRFVRQVTLSLAWGYMAQFYELRGRRQSIVERLAGDIFILDDQPLPTRLLANALKGGLRLRLLQVGLRWSQTLPVSHSSARMTQYLADPSPGRLAS